MDDTEHSEKLDFCNLCKYVTTCDCPNCERAFCTFHEYHIHDFTLKEIKQMKCFSKEKE